MIPDLNSQSVKVHVQHWGLYHSGPKKVDPTIFGLAWVCMDPTETLGIFDFFQRLPGGLYFYYQFLHGDFY